MSLGISPFDGVPRLFFLCGKGYLQEVFSKKLCFPVLTSVPFPSVELSSILRYYDAMIFPRFFLKAKEEADILLGSPWVYDNELLFVKYMKAGAVQQMSLEAAGSCKKLKAVEAGSAVEVYSKSGLFLGTGIFNPNSKIAIRFLTQEKPESVWGPVEENSKESLSLASIHNQYTKEFFLQKVKQALELRYLFFNKADSYRLIFGESDGIPGLVVDRYYDVEGRVFLSIQFLSL